VNFIAKFRVKHSGDLLEQLRTVQALRAVAALAVMFAHLHGIEARQSGESYIISDAWIVGVSGVDLFFVISGFIMVWIAGETPSNLRNSANFLFARILRIYPLWWLFSGAIAIYFFVTYGQPWDADKLTALNVGGPEHLIKSFLLLPHDAFPILPLGWTLIHEMYFYCVFAALLLIPQTYRVPAMMVWGLIIVAAISAGLAGYYASDFRSLILHPMTLEFLMGAGVAWMIKAGWTKMRWLALIVGSLGSVWALVSINFYNTTNLLAVARTFSFGPAFALILYALVVFERETTIGKRIPDALVRLGDWSYSLYLCHLLVASSVGRVFFAALGQDGPIDNAAFIVLAIAACIVSAGLTYTWFERPVLSASRKARDSLFSKHP